MLVKQQNIYDDVIDLEAQHSLFYGLDNVKQRKVLYYILDFGIFCHGVVSDIFL